MARFRSHGADVHDCSHCGRAVECVLKCWACTRLRQDPIPRMTDRQAAENSMPKRIELVVPAEQAGARLDRFLALELSEISRTRIQELMDQGRVLVDGAAMKPSHKVEEGAMVIIDIPPTPPAGVDAENIPLSLIYEDEDIAVINKPAGMIVHPGAGADTGTLVAALLHRFGGVSGLSTIGGPLRSGIVHRLDKETSGAIVIARNDAAHRKLVKDFQSRSVEKTYVGLLHGKLKGEKGRVDLPVARDLHRRARMTARRLEGREARTDWKALLHLDGFTLIEADLHTGRTHQIRVHFSARGANRVCPPAHRPANAITSTYRAGTSRVPESSCASNKSGSSFD